MKTVICNFELKNWAWQDCPQPGAIAVMDGVRVHDFFLTGDKQGGIRAAHKHLRALGGPPVNRSVASRWYGMNTLLLENDGDLWLHKDLGRLRGNFQACSPPNLHPVAVGPRSLAIEIGIRLKVLHTGKIDSSVTSPTSIRQTPVTLLVALMPCMNLTHFALTKRRRSISYGLCPASKLQMSVVAPEWTLAFCPIWSGQADRQPDSTWLGDACPGSRSAFHHTRSRLQEGTLR
jgi:hypothetical protein